MPLIKNAVGNNMKNEPSDMIRVKNALINAGYLEEPELHGYITRSTDNAIRAFQLANNLKVDGILKPGGETETALQWMPPVPGRKPAVPVVPLTLEDFQKVPAQKADLFKDKAQSDAWASWTALVDADTDLPDNMKAAFKSIYAWEGGMKPHKDSSVVAGITQETLKSLAAKGYDVKPDQGDLSPKNLSQEKILTTI